MLPKKIYLNYVNEDDEYKTWSEDPVHIHCDMQNREYTDLSQVWHNIYEIPEIKNRLILFCDKYNCICSEFIPYEVGQQSHQKTVGERVDHIGGAKSRTETVFNIKVRNFLCEYLIFVG